MNSRSLFVRRGRIKSDRIRLRPGVDRCIGNLQLRLERLKYRSRLRQELFQNFFDRRPMSERYEEGRWEIQPR
jgi:hypothetical protein